MKKLILAASLALASLAAQATVINFNGYQNTIYGDENVANGLEVVSTQGFQFFSSGDHFHFVDLSSYGGPSNGTSVLMEDRDFTITMKTDNNSKFDFLSMLASGFGSSGTLSITGYNNAGSVNASLNVNNNGFTSTTLTGFTGLSRVVFSGSRSLSFSIDNLEVAASKVPEPASLSLLLLGVAGLALGRKRRA